MSQTQSKTYSLPDPAAVAAKIKAAGGPQIDPTAPSGQATADGVTLAWQVISSNPEQITVTVLSKPWIIGYNAIWEHVDAVLGDPK